MQFYDQHLWKVVAGLWHAISLRLTNVSWTSSQWNECLTDIHSNLFVYELIVKRSKQHIIRQWPVDLVIWVNKLGFFSWMMRLISLRRCYARLTFWCIVRYRYAICYSTTFLINVYITIEELNRSKFNSSISLYYVCL
jgi:hypothetical protein